MSLLQSRCLAHEDTFFYLRSTWSWLASNSELACESIEFEQCFGLKRQSPLDYYFLKNSLDQMQSSRPKIEPRRDTKLSSVPWMHGVGQFILFLLDMHPLGGAISIVLQFSVIRKGCRHFEKLLAILGFDHSASGAYQSLLHASVGTYRWNDFVSYTLINADASIHDRYCLIRRNPSRTNVVVLFESYS